MTPMTPDVPAICETEELMADVWTMCSQARVGSYQHAVSSAPWIVLSAAESALSAHLLKEQQP